MTAVGKVAGKVVVVHRGAFKQTFHKDLELGPMNDKQKIVKE